MKIKIKVKPNSKTPGIEQVGQSSFIVRVKAKPQDGKANQEVIKVLAKHFHTTQSNIKILTGKTSGSKVITIE